FDLLHIPLSYSLFPFTPLFRSSGSRGDGVRRDFAVKRTNGEIRIQGRVLRKLFDLVRKACAGPDPGCVSRRWSASRVGSCASFSDRKSTRLNSSHLVISYAVFC